MPASGWPARLDASMAADTHCSICGSPTTIIGSVPGVLDQRRFVLRHCEACRFSFVENHRTDYRNLYDQDYYTGKGADPLVHYIEEMGHPDRTVRYYEWQGIRTVQRHFFPEGCRWLDFGCGPGGLVKHASASGMDVTGFEEGWAAEYGRQHGIRIIDAEALEEHRGWYDFVTAIEVLEHIPEPLGALRKIRRSMRPGAVLFLTTGNARPWRRALLKWSYTQCPDVHVAFYEPETMEKCLLASGFTPGYLHSHPAYNDIIKYKILKNVGIQHRHRIIDALPWKLITRMVDGRYKVSAMPYGIAV